MLASVNKVRNTPKGKVRVARAIYYLDMIYAFAAPWDSELTMSHMMIPSCGRYRFHKSSPRFTSVHLPSKQKCPWEERSHACKASRYCLLSPRQIVQTPLIPPYHVPSCIYCARTNGVQAPAPGTYLAVEAPVLFSFSHILRNRV